jgi:ABC-type lipoprotein release transport system permease subunit
MNSLLVFGGLMLAAYAALIVIAIRRPLFARIAVREASRRPWQSALVICGLMVGSGAVLSSNVLKDSITDSATRAAAQQWGRVDVTVSAPGGASFSPRIAQDLSHNRQIRRLATGAQAGVELVGSAADLDQQQTISFVRFIGFDPATQPPFGAFQLAGGGSTVGQTLEADQAIISESLANALHARVGDRLHVSLAEAGPEASPANTVFVAAIATPYGAGSYGLRPALYLTLPAIQRLDGTQDIDVVRFSVAGSGQHELDAAHQLAGRVHDALAGMPGAAGLSVWEAKGNEIQAAIQGQAAGAGSSPSDVFAGFVVLAGVVLVVNLMVTLVEERRPRLAVLRALGLSRAGLVAVLSMEGALYALAAGIMGCLPGLLLAFLLYNDYAGTSSGIVGQAGGGLNAAGRDARVFFSLRPAAVALAVAVGAVVTLLCLVGAAIASSRFTIAAAVRDLPEPTSQSATSRSRTALLIALTAFGLFGLAVPSPLLHMLGGSALIADAAIAGRRWISTRARMTIAGLVLAAWSLISLAIVFVSNIASAFDVAGSLFLAIILSTFGLALAVSANLRLLEGAAAGMGRGLARIPLILRPALAYMTRRPTMTGLTIATFALLLSVIVIYNSLVAMFMTATSEAPFTLRVFVPTRTAVALPASIEQQISRTVSVPTRLYLGPVRLASPPGSPAVWHEERIALYQVTPDEFSASFFGTGITNRTSEFRDDAAAWQDLATDPSRVLWTRFGTNVDLTMAGARGPVSRRVVGDAGNPMFDGVIGSRQALAPFAGLPLGTTLLIATRPGVDAHALVRQIRAALYPDGADVATLQDLLDQQNLGFQAFASAWDLYMRAGLVVAILSLGILAVRAGIGRRRAIGVLRALGYRRSDIVAGTIGEATVTTTIGAIFALVVGTVVVYLYARFTLGPQLHLGFELPTLASALGLMYAAVVLATFWPAVSAARTPPAQALRLLE